MRKLTIVLIISILCMMTGDTGEKTYTHVPVSLSFIPGISVGGFMGGDIITNASINIIAGRHAKEREFNNSPI